VPSSHTWAVANAFDDAVLGVDAHEDSNPDLHWCWEAHPLLSLPKAVRPLAEAGRKHRKGALERLKALKALEPLLRGTSHSKAAEGKLTRMAAKAARLPTAAQLRAALMDAMTPVQCTQQVCVLCGVAMAFILSND